MALHPGSGEDQKGKEFIVGMAPKREGCLGCSWRGRSDAAVSVNNAGLEKCCELPGIAWTPFQAPEANIDSRGLRDRSEAFPRVEAECGYQDRSASPE